ncbi:RNA-binding protein [Haloplanus sp.]|uniref:RNA-binding protein n=1 Tax=Haloplanus sp. TaxID=1961696 RepID=UPI00261E3FBB|nr:RNA-binding protein [Haloplanus sp.]
MEVKSRHHLRSDEIRELEATLDAALGVGLDGEAYERVDLVGTEFDLVLVDGEPQVFAVDDERFLTVRGANAHPPERRVVTVDAGAVQFVSDGADVMRPGIVDADEVIDPGDLIVVVEETHGKALAVGRSLEPGADLPGDSGKVVESVHHVGDDLYEFSV